MSRPSPTVERPNRVLAVTRRRTVRIGQLRTRSVSIAIVGAMFWTAAVGPLESPAQAISFTFQVRDFSLRTLPATEWPYYSTTVLPLVDSGVHDAAGVRMVNIGGVLYNHPVAQAQYALGLIYSYLQSGVTTYLARAEAQAQRLIQTGVTSRNALYFPYPFNFARHGKSSDTMVAPWYSAMAQGQGLTVLVRLFEITANEAYRTAAVATYNTFLNLKAAGVPWTVFLDGSGYVWFEEYAKDPPDKTYNGLTFAVYGLWDYYRLMQDPDALLLIRGGLTTISAYFPSIRAPAWISRYCLTHGVQNAFYHQVHLEQMLTLYRMTGDAEFGRDGDALYVDYPWASIAGTAQFAAGTFTGHQFDVSGNITAGRTATLSRPSSAPFGLRQRIKGRSGYWFWITAGIWAGYWIPEIPGQTYQAGLLPGGLTYGPPRTVSFAAGTYTGLTFNSGGGVTASRTGVLPRASSAHANQRVVINGSTYLAIVDGRWAGMYIKLGAGITY